MYAISIHVHTCTVSEKYGSIRIYMYVLMYVLMYVFMHDAFL